jgi:putative thioredoxin
MSDKPPRATQTSHATFQQDVIERSREVPVVLDFWSERCQPCRLLGPLLEKLAEEFAGKFALVKANTDQMPDLAASFGVSAIPAVFAIRDARVVDQFLGLMPESQIRAWLEGILPSEAEDLTAEAQSLETTDPQTAEARYREAVELSPNDTSARAGLARLLLAQDRLEEASQTIEELATAGALDANGQKVQAELVVALEGKQAGSVDQCRAAAEASPDDPDTQLSLAKSLAAAGEHQEAMEVCLRLLSKNRHGIGEQARQLMVHVFHVLGPESQLAADYRRKLTMVLY